MDGLSTYISASGVWQVGEIPEGADANILAQAARERQGVSVFVAREDTRAAAFYAAFQLFAPDIDIIHLPAWDCLPYDRISPSRVMASRRAGALFVLSHFNNDKPVLVLTTISALTQRVPPRFLVGRAGMQLEASAFVKRERLDQYFVLNGYMRASTVIEPGDYAIRGGLVDVFPPRFDKPLRLDFFGDRLESIRSFDPDTQISLDRLDDFTLAPVSEVFLNPETIGHFRRGYIESFGGGLSGDPVYAAVSKGIRYQGMEHWLPLFYPEMATIFDYIPENALWAFDGLVTQVLEERSGQIADYYQDRSEGAGDKAGQSPSCRALSPEHLYIDTQEFSDQLPGLTARLHSVFSIPGGKNSLNMGSVPARNFSRERQTEGVNVFDTAKAHILALAQSGQKVLLACWSEGSSERMGSVLADHDLVPGQITGNDEFNRLEAGQIKRIVLPIEHGFTLADLSVISEPDILGDRLVQRRRRPRGKNFIAEVSTLEPGDLVIHIEHGLGRYVGLEPLDIQSAPHDCLKIEYAGSGTLYLPVENIELLSRYGEGGDNIVLDRLGGTAWPTRKARARKRLKDMAVELVRIAAQRVLHHSDPVEIPGSSFAGFCARFPYAETSDQLEAIEEVVADLTSSRPMDRLICGDVGFGKTEVMLRAAFLVAMSGRQVAVVTPTTILCRQHFETFRNRFRGLPVRIRQLSRLVAAKRVAEVHQELANGQCDIVVGTHALLARSVSFSDLDLLVIDEEQRFGVVHKERLKALRANINVLTLTATPIPRTLQMALSGIRDLSLISTPPVDRLAVRTFITPYDQVILREALLREKYRGGQSFFVVPRIAHIRRCEEFLRTHVPEVKPVIAHGRMPTRALEDTMTAFYDGQYDVLLSTSIIESGLDIPSTNTIIIYRADRFGLAQLYQLRGRVGRSKVRAFAYLTTPEDKSMTPGALKRLKILQSLDTLGAGFSLASHDLDMRGGGNPMGEEQSGHIKDLGVELYLHMLEETVAELRDGEVAKSRIWSPQVNLGIPVLIPETYVEDLNVRMSLYRRMSAISSDVEEDAFASELIDRFGALPGEVENLLKILSIKRAAKTAKIEKIDAGPKGVVFIFRHAEIENPAVILDQVKDHTNWRLRPDQAIFVPGVFSDTKSRLQIVDMTVRKLTLPLQGDSSKPRASAQS